MEFDEYLEMYVYEVNDIIFAWEEEPKDDYKSKVAVIARKYKEKLHQIIQFMLPDLKTVYGDFDENEVESKLGKPTIYVENGTVNYLEHTFDRIHIFSFEYLDEDFNNLQYFSIDG